MALDESLDHHEDTVTLAQWWSLTFMTHFCFVFLAYIAIEELNMGLPRLDWLAVVAFAALAGWALRDQLKAMPHSPKDMAITAVWAAVIFAEFWLAGAINEEFRGTLAHPERWAVLAMTLSAALRACQLSHYDAPVWAQGVSAWLRESARQKH